MEQGSSDLAVKLELTGTIVRISRTNTESQRPGERPVAEDSGWVEVELGLFGTPRLLTVPFPVGVPFGLRLGQPVTLTFQGLDAESPIDQMVAERAVGSE